MNLVADDLRLETAPGVEGSRALSMQSGHLQPEGSETCKLAFDCEEEDANSSFLPSFDLKDFASRAHCRWAAGSWLAPSSKEEPSTGRSTKSLFGISTARYQTFFLTYNYLRKLNKPCTLQNLHSGHFLHRYHKICLSVSLPII